MKRTEKLMKAIEQHDLDQVRLVLRQGADPNGRIRLNAGFESSVLQPDTPLKLVVFCISDSLLDETGLLDFRDIALELLKAGADPVEPLQMAKERYGDFTKSTIQNEFVSILNLIHGFKRE